MILYNKKIIGNLQFLDNILKIILEYGCNSPIEQTLFIRKLNEIESKNSYSKRLLRLRIKFLDKKNGLSNIDDIDAEFCPYLEKLENALSFLHSEDLINFNEQGFTVSITYKGIVKLSGGGFVKEYKNQVWSKTLQNTAWIFSIISFFVGLFFNKLFLSFIQ